MVVNKIKNCVLITGSSGFIGFHLSKYLISMGMKVVGLDAMTDYYDLKLKYNRLKILEKNSNFHSYIGNVNDQNLLCKICEKFKPDTVIHLAAQAGVRYSIENPQSYVESNLLGTFNILEVARKIKPKHLLIASTSSIYGNNKDLPFNECQKSDTPISFYAATKKSNEVMAHSYSHLYKIPTTIFRFFTIYGSWGRPDMALFKFTKNILSNKPIDIFNKGKMSRDFTHVSDLVEAINLLIKIVPLLPEERKSSISFDSISETAPFRIVNIGNSKPIPLMEYILELEKVIGKKSTKNFVKIHKADLKDTFSNNKLLKNLTGFTPKINLSTGIIEFVDWYKQYYLNR